METFQVALGLAPFAKRPQITGEHLSLIIIVLLEVLSICNQNLARDVML